MMKKDNTSSNDAYAVFREMFAQHEAQLKAMIRELQAQHDLQSRHVVNEAVSEAFSRFENRWVQRGKPNGTGNSSFAVSTEPQSRPPNTQLKEPVSPNGEPPDFELNRPDDVETLDLCSPSTQKGPANCVVDNFMVDQRASKPERITEKVLKRDSTFEKFKSEQAKKQRASTKSNGKLTQVQPVAPTQESVDTKPDPIASVTRLVQSSQFDSAMAFVIIVSAIFIFVQTEWMSQNPATDLPEVFQIAEGCFTAIFSVEVILRIVAFRSAFFTGPDRGWHFMDLVVVTTAIIEIAATSSALQNMAVLRLLRILRIVRVTRILRALKIFTNLRMMVMGIINCGDSLLWAIVLLMLIIFLFAACLTQVVSGTLGEGTDALSANEVDQLKDSYGSLFRTVYSLFKAVAGGTSWGEFSDPLLTISPALCLLFCLFIIFVTFAVLNIITGIFVESSFKSLDSDREMKILEYGDKMEASAQAAREVFFSIDEDSSGLMDWDEFRTNLHNEKLQSYFHELDLEINDEATAWHLFSQLDFDDSGTIGVDEFLFGLKKVKGPARSVDMARVLHNQKSHSEFLMLMAEEFASLSSSTAEILQICKNMR